MIVNLSNELDEILDILDLTKDDVTSEQAMRVMTVCFKCFDKGFGQGNERAVHIVQRMAINPQPIVNEIRRPVR